MGADKSNFTPLIKSIQADSKLKELKELKIHHPNFDKSGDTSVPEQATTILNSLPNKELKIHHPNFDKSGDTSVPEQATTILNSLPNDVEEYDYIALVGQSMGGSALWLLLDQLITKGFAKKLLIATYSAPNPKTGIPLFVNGPSVIAIVDILKSWKFFTLLARLSLKISQQNINELENLVKKKGVSGFATYLSEDAGQGTKDLKPNSPVMAKILRIMEGLGAKIPSLAVVGTNRLEGFKKMFPMLKESLFGIGHELVCHQINKDSLKSMRDLFKLNKRGALFSEDLKHDGLVPIGPPLPNTKRIEVNHYHDHTTQGKLEETPHGSPEGVSALTNFIREEIMIKIMENR